MIPYSEGCDMALEYLPDGFKITNMQPGSLVFMPGDEPME
jgi:hypothetical protein